MCVCESRLPFAVALVKLSEFNVGYGPHFDHVMISVRLVQQIVLVVVTCFVICFRQAQGRKFLVLISVGTEQKL